MSGTTKFDLDTFGVSFVRAAIREIVRSGRADLCAAPDTKQWQIAKAYEDLGGDGEELEWPNARPQRFD